METIMNTATAMYALGLDQAVKLILSVGHKRTILLQGHMGCGKSSTLGMLSKELPDHTALYFDCTTKDLILEEELIHIGKEQFMNSLCAFYL